MSRRKDERKKNLRCCIVALSIMLAVLFIFPNMEESQAFASSSSAPENSALVNHQLMKNFHDQQLPRVNKASSKTYKKYAATADSLPSKVDLRSYNGKSYVTSVKDQGYYGCCWAFAAESAIESNLLMNNYGEYDLSELQLAYFTYNNPTKAASGLSGDKSVLSDGDNYADTGGDFYYSSTTFSKWYGMANEADAPFDTYADLPETLADKLAYSSNAVQLKNVNWIDASDINAVKTNLLKYGAGDFGFYIYDIGNDDTAYWDYDHNCYYLDKKGYYAGLDGEDGSELDGHEITLVGWDDNYPASNFGGTSGAKPEHDGAWLCKNSWGTGSDIGECEDGYFWISYDDYYLSKVKDYEDYVAFYDVVPVSQGYDNIYQYDGGNNTSDRVSKNATAKTCNIFKARNDSTLKAVGFESYNTNLKYSIQVYQNSDRTKPTSGKKLLSEPVTGTLSDIGYHIISLNQSVNLEKGERFSVVVTLKDGDGSSIALPLDTSCYNGSTTYISSSKAYKSYYDLGYGWRDCGKSGHCNTKVKAYTNNL